MSAEKHPDWLINRLYLDELDDETSSDGQDNLNPEQEAQLLEMQQFLGQLRDHVPHMPMAAPSEKTRQSILAAAQEALETGYEDVSATTRTPQKAPRSGSDSLWGKYRFHAIAQITGVAAILIVGVFGLAQFQNQMKPTMDAAAPEMAKATKIQKPAVASNEKADEPAGKDFPDTNATAKPKPSLDQSKTLALNKDLKKEADADNKPSVEDNVQSKSANGVKRNARRKAVAMKPKKSKKSMANDDGFSFSGLSNSGKRSTYRGNVGQGVESESKKEVSSLFKSPEAPSNAKGSKEVAINDLNTSAPQSEPPASKAITRPATAPTKRSASAPVATNKPALDAKKSTKTSSTKKADAKTATPTVSGIERSFRAEKFDNTLTEANQYLKTGKGTSRQRARVMELKAKAYQKLGRNDEAARIFDQIRKKYPTYYKKKAIKYPAKKSRRKSKSSFDALDKF